MSDHETVIQAYKNQTVAHARLQECYVQLQKFHTMPDSEQVILVVGPSGVGKSKLIERTHQDCLDHYQSDMEQDPGFTPSILMKLPSPTPRVTGRSDFEWKDAFIRLLESGNEILIRKKIIPKAKIELDGEVISDIHRLGASELRRSIENFVKYRRTRQVILDEAGHIFVADSGRNYHLHFEMLKSMAIAFRRPLILCGSYDLLKATELNGQLARRIVVIHFARYTDEDFIRGSKAYGESFINIVYSLLERIPIPKEDGLIDHIDYFLMKSLGCCGLLKEWLERALELAIQNPNPVITREILEKTALPTRQLQKLLQEIKLGESMLKDSEDKLLAAELGLEYTPTLKEKQKSTPNQPQVENQKYTAKKSRVGTRNPSRDPIGVIEDAA